MKIINFVDCVHDRRMLTIVDAPFLDNFPLD